MTAPQDREQTPPSATPGFNAHPNVSPHRTPTTDVASDPCPEPPSEQPQSTGPSYSVFEPWRKKSIVLASAVFALLSPVSAQIYLPALNDLAEAFDVSDAKINLTITTYMIFQGLVPMFIGSFADTFGRRPAYIICFTIYIAANIGLALAPDYASLLVLRCLQSAGSSSTVALCIGVVADIVTSAERGQYVGFTSVPVVLGPSLGPVIGGLLVQYLGWRSIFWFLTIFGGVTMALLVLFFPETGRKIVGDGSIQPPPIYRTLPQGLASRRARNVLEKTDSRAPKTKFKLPNPFSSMILLFEKSMGLLLTMGAVVFAGFYAIATAMPTQLKKNYGLSDIQIGLMYLPMAGGSLGAAGFIGLTVNRNYARHCRRLGLPLDKKVQQDMTNFPIERVRLEVGMPLLLISGIVVVAWGWAMKAQAHIAVICVLLFLMGVSLVGFSNVMNTLVSDISRGRAATATAANNLTRCLLGAAATAAIVPMIDGIGIGWAFTVFGALYVAAFPGLFLLMKKGMSWRQAEHDRRNKKHEARQHPESPVDVTVDSDTAQDTRDKPEKRDTNTE
ncbi:major facilitator superfamily transporter [Zalerion maritima]|uniref:Major facilitator superfamily transporter n=1 Tax=Zalerion maritima TaxID=339359 RepID=A0AAD5RS96_9PEZI|nr:major facilitator superfamily transporter [Zalerion maritima]